MNRRGFLKGLEALSAAPFLPKVLPLAEEEVGWKVLEEYGPSIIDTRVLNKSPQVFVYLNGVLQMEGLSYEVVPHKDRVHTVEFYEPVPDASAIQIVTYPSDDDHITMVSQIDRYGAQINERPIHYSA